jgi:hypothetical protein
MLIVAVTAKPPHQIATLSLRCYASILSGAKLATKENGSIGAALVTLPVCRRCPFSSMNPTTTFN